MSKVFGGLLSFIGAKPRLFIEYAIITVLLVVMGLCGYLWTERDRINKEVAELSSTIDVVVDANNEQDKAISELLETREKDINSLKEYIEKSTMLAEEKADLQARLDQLESKNESIKEYLNVTVPADVVELLIISTKRVYNED